MRTLFYSTFLVLFSFQLVAQDTITPDKTVMVPMRDGTELPADIYLSKTATEKAPCILMRNPSGRQAAHALCFVPLTMAGYTVVIQDTRCAVDKEGKTLPYWTDGWGNQQDGYDTVEWLAKSEYTNGKIGTVGCSSLGITQLLMAPTAPPSLKCQYIGMAAANLYGDAIFPGGQLLKNQVEGWLGLYARDPSVLKYICGQTTDGPFWQNFNTNLVADRVKVPAIIYGGWYDTFLQGTLDAYMARQERGSEGAKGTQKLIIGPWTHFWPQNLKIGDFDIPKAGLQPPVDISPQRWFDYYLKGTANEADKIPTVSYFVMGPLDGSSTVGNVWKHSDRWPVPAKETALYLTANKTLTEQSSEQIKTATFSYDSEKDNPVPTLGGRNLFIESGAKDQRSIEQRPDVIVFTSEPLTQDLEVTGRLKAKLYVSTPDNDLDIAVRLTDVYPDGKSILIADGLSHYHQEKVSSEPKPVEIDLWSTSQVFAKGHRIRISVSGSNYPKYEKILCNSNKITKTLLFVGGPTPSQILLPIVSRGPTPEATVVAK